MAKLDLELLLLQCLLNAGQSLDSPSIDEGDMYYFRVETSAPAGTNLYYRVENSSSDDFITVDADTLPDTTIGLFHIQLNLIPVYLMNLVEE